MTKKTEQHLLELYKKIGQLYNWPILKELVDLRFYIYIITQKEKKYGDFIRISNRFKEIRRNKF